ncbi:glycerate 2-kinase [Chitinophaga sp. CF118]|uniref:glycerate kinase type-2 family protein n=1 Tax=Chitinophaga sp. CF118 TaxID=1884367 RepID=UPI0008F43CB4|nr:glycerate kinase [Chitinophaga sp. CF118]SFE78656.1 glycerate 2-kinase [Chitinophaga sp. CF118]
MSREHAISIFKQAVAAVQPSVLMKKNVQREKDTIRIAGHPFHLSPGRPVWILGAGKASAAMTLALEEILAGIPLQGLVITKYGHALPLQHITLIEAAHPVPDDNGVQGTLRMKSLLKQVQENDLVIFLLSGGASALLADYPEGTTLAEVQTVFEMLLKSGANIHEMNVVRKHLSAIKGGQLALLANTTAFCCLILSDVPGDDLHVIGSGPTVPDPSSFADAAAILKKYNLQLPESIYQHLLQGINGNIPDTPKPGNPRFNTIHNFLIGNNQIALDAAASKAEELGYEVHILTATATGEASLLARQLVQQAVNWQGKRPACLLMGGESTVTVTGNGLGGRNQQLALAAAVALQDHHPEITLLSAGTDGTDGPTDAAGAIADAALMAFAKEKGLDAAGYLQRHDAWHFFEQTNGLLKTGATQTNVMDIIVVIINY